MIVMILLVSSCRGPCCCTSAFDAAHPNVVIDYVRTNADALKLIPLSKPDLVVLGTDVQDTVDFRHQVARLSANTRVGALPCNQTGPESALCARTTSDFMGAIAPMFRKETPSTTVR